MTEDVAVQLDEPQEGGVGQDDIVITQTGDVRWSTPGVAVADAINSLPQVRFVLEKLEPDRYTIFVVLADDPDEVLDRIYDTERSLYETFPWTPFDLRVMKPSDDWSPSELLQATICRYRRP